MEAVVCMEVTVVLLVNVCGSCLCGQKSCGWRSRGQSFVDVIRRVCGWGLDGGYKSGNRGGEDSGGGD